MMRQCDKLRKPNDITKQRRMRQKESGKRFEGLKSTSFKGMLVSWKNGFKRELKTGSRICHIRKKENRVSLSSSTSRLINSMK
jgi:hypothetical protein